MISAKITTKYDLVDMLINPEKYIDEYSDTEFLTIPHEEAKGKIVRFLVGVEDGKYYIAIEDDYCVIDYFFPEQGETLLQAFVRSLNDNLMREG